MVSSFWSILACLAPATELPPATAHALESGFIENVGQFDPAVRFVRTAAAGPVFVTSDRLALRLGSTDPSEPSAVVHLVFEGGEARSVRATDPDTTLRNFLIGRDPGAWRSGVRSFGRVTLEAVWPGIDVVLTTNSAGIEYDFVLVPGADPDRIRVRCDGVTRLNIDESGTTRLETHRGALEISKPRTFLDDGVGMLREIASRHRLLDATHLAFEVADRGPGSAGNRLVIDPTIAFATFMGGSAFDVCHATQFDAAGAIYQVGETLSLDFPSAAGVQPTLAGGFDGFIAKLNANGASAQWVAYFGGSGDDLIRDLDVVESVGGSLATFTGYTTSSDLPLSSSPADATLGGLADLFVARLAPDGARLTYSTYLGGSADEGMDGSGSLDPPFSTPSLRCLGNGATWIAGHTASIDFPQTPGAVDTAVDSLGLGDGFFTRLSATGSSFEYSTYLGGSGLDVVTDIEISSSGECLVTGSTSSADLPTTPGAWLRSFPVGTNESAFTARVQTANATISALTYLVATLPQLSTHSIAEDASQRVLICGSAVDPFSTSFENFGTASILRLDPNLSVVEAIGEYGAGAVTDVAFDSLGRLFAAANLKVGTPFQGLAMRVDDELMPVTTTLGLLNAQFADANSIAVGPLQRFALSLGGQMQSPITAGSFDPVASQGDGALVVGDLECAGGFTTPAPGCPGSIGTTPLLHGSGCPIAGSQFTLRISQAAGTTALLFFGLGSNVLPLTPNCALAIGPLTPVILTLPVVPSSLPQLGGVGLITSGVPPLAAAVDVWLQAIVVNAAPAQPTFAVTNALRMHASP